MGRPLKAVDAQQVEKLAAIGCTLEEIATVVGCSHDTLERRFASALKEGWALRNMSLRRAQFKYAMNGNPALLIWLGRNLLGQKQGPFELVQTGPLDQLLDEFRKRNATLTASPDRANGDAQPQQPADVPAPRGPGNGRRNPAGGDDP